MVIKDYSRQYPRSFMAQMLMVYKPVPVNVISLRKQSSQKSPRLALAS